jgi:hypothetical protein
VSMTHEELARDLAVIEAATEGPWVADRGPIVQMFAPELEVGAVHFIGPMEIGSGTPQYPEVFSTTVFAGYADDNNVAFMEAARVRWPLYVAEVQRQAARIKELNGLVSKLVGCGVLIRAAVPDGPQYERTVKAWDDAVADVFKEQP